MNDVGHGFVASLGLRFQPWSTPALHVCCRQVQRRQKKKCLAGFFLNFGFVWQVRDFVTGAVRQSWELYFEQRVRRSLLHSCAPIRFFPGAPTQGVYIQRHWQHRRRCKLEIDLSWASDFQYFLNDFLPNSIRTFSSSFQRLQTVVTEKNL